MDSCFLDVLYPSEHELLRCIEVDRYLETYIPTKYLVIVPKDDFKAADAAKGTSCVLTILNGSVSIQLGRMRSTLILIATISHLLTLVKSLGAPYTLYMYIVHV